MALNPSNADSLAFPVWGSLAFDDVGSVFVSLALGLSVLVSPAASCTDRESLLAETTSADITWLVVEVALAFDV